MGKKTLKIGGFYWMQPAFDPDTDNVWENEPQPARYEGEGKWTCLGVEGISDWPARWVGDELTPPQQRDVAPNSAAAALFHRAATEDAGREEKKATSPNLR